MTLSTLMIAGALIAASSGQAPPEETRDDEPRPPALLEAGNAYLDSLTGEWNGPTLDERGVPLGMQLVGDMIVPDVASPAGFTPTPWPDGIVYFEFDANVSSDNRLKALEAMNEWVYSQADVTFVPRTNQSNYIHIQDNCCFNNSFVGMASSGQILNMKDWGEKFIIAHEYCHALGFWHEQSRPDRDDYVVINWDNICQDCCSGGACDSNFDIRDGWLTLGTPYDFSSVMHYDECAFSNCSPWCGGVFGCQTIAVPSGENVGQYDFLSFLDTLDMANVYGFGGSPRFVDLFNFGEADGTVARPARTFELGLGFLPAGDTLWVRSGEYDVTNIVYSKPGIIRTYGGSVTLK